MQPGTGKLRLGNVPRTAPSASNRLKTFHFGFNSTKTIPVCWGHPDPQKDQALGFGKAPEGRKSGAGRRKSAVDQILLWSVWLGTSSAAVIYY